MTITWPRLSFTTLLPLIRPTKRRPSTPRWIASAPNDLTDAEAAAFGRTHPLREAQALHEFLCAGGAAVVRR